MSTYSSVRDGIETALLTVPDIGLVHDYWRLAKDTSGFKEIASTKIGGVSQVRVWFIRFTGIEPQPESPFGQVTWLYQFEVDGYRSLNDDAATEKEFMALVEGVLHVLAEKRNFGAAEVRIYSTMIAGMAADFRTLSETLCHHARIDLTIEVDHSLDWS